MGLYFEDARFRGLTHVQLASYTTSLDDYYLYKTGERKQPAQKPRQRMDAEFRRLLIALNASGVSGRVEASLALLDLSHDTRRAVMQLLEKVRRIYRRERRIVDGTAYAQEKTFAVSVMLGADRDELLRNFRLYAAKKLQQTGETTWLGIALVPGKVDVIAEVQVRWHTQES